MKNSIAILLFILPFYGICQQNVDLKDNTIKIQDDLKGILDDSVDQIFYTTSHKTLLFILTDTNHYFFYEFEHLDDNGLAITGQKTLSSNIGKTLFDRTKYVSGYVNFSSKFYDEYPLKSSVGRPLYFVYYINGKIYCEYNLTTLVAPSPINKKVNYIYFLFLVDKEDELNKI